MGARFPELDKVKIVDERFGDYEGYVVASQFRNGRWVYKISISEHSKKLKTWDNWIPEECLEKTK
jgi:hypothetical protein